MPTCFAGTLCVNLLTRIAINMAIINPVKLYQILKISGTLLKPKFSNTKWIEVSPE